ncbi:MAG TPA: AAA family ATPase [Myxococcota bacterium]|nr:AAA family ATPase [Myxococcota bacterium]
MFTELRCRRYRCFRDEQRLTLDRLTLVYGENNAGKSALGRLLPWLAASHTPDRAGLALDAAPLRGAGWADIKWRGAATSSDDPHLVIGCTIDGSTRWTWHADWSDAWRQPVVQRLELDAAAHVDLTWRLMRGEAQSATRAYVIDDRALALTLDGVVPRPIEGTIDPRVVSVLRAHLARVTWLAARRSGPTREGLPRGRQGTLDGDGRGAEAIALADRELRGRASTWYEGVGAGALTVEALGADLERLTLSPPGAALDVAFPDLGEGLQQVFPVLVALEQLRDRGGLLVIEEPESHLHPRLQASLVERMIEVLVARPDAQLLLETHSEVFLLAALEVAAARLAGRVGLAWVELGRDGACAVEPITLRPDGRPESDRLERAFDTMGVLRRRVLEARRGHLAG